MALAVLLIFSTPTSYVLRVTTKADANLLRRGQSPHRTLEFQSLTTLSAFQDTHKIPGKPISLTAVLDGEQNLTNKPAHDRTGIRNAIIGSMAGYQLQHAAKDSPRAEALLDRRRRRKRCTRVQHCAPPRVAQ